jgi:hypothetical protein
MTSVLNNFVLNNLSTSKSSGNSGVVLNSTPINFSPLGGSSCRKFFFQFAKFFPQFRIIFDGLSRVEDSNFPCFIPGLDRYSKMGTPPALRAAAFEDNAPIQSCNRRTFPSAPAKRLA